MSRMMEIEDETETTPVIMIEKELPFTSIQDVMIQSSGTEKEQLLLNNLSPAEKERCYKMICRLFLFKCSKVGSVSQSEVTAALKAINPLYTKLTKIMMPEVQKRVLDMTGYLIIDADDIKGYDNDNKPTIYFLYNTLTMPSLRNIAVSAMPRKEMAFHGLMFVIFHIILNAPACKIRQSELLIKLNTLDPRFPKNLTTAKGAIEELGDSMKDLLKRMKDEHYIMLEAIKKNESTSEEGADSFVSFGPRFYLEIGKKHLLLSYYNIIGEPVDNCVIAEYCREESTQGESENV